MNGQIDYKNLATGDRVEIHQGRGPLGVSSDFVWHILKVPPMGEESATVWLRLIGAIDVWYPTETKRRPAPRTKQKWKNYEAKIVPGYLFVLFDREINWDVLFDTCNHRLSGVVSIHGIPYRLPEDQLARMQRIPKRLKVMAQKLKDQQMREMLARIPSAGQKAEITHGPFEGYQVDVERIDKGIAYFILGGFPGSAPIEHLRKDEK